MKLFKLFILIMIFILCCGCVSQRGHTGTTGADGKDGSNEALYPISTVYITTSTDNPADLLGFGTWNNLGTGYVLVGV